MPAFSFRWNIILKGMLLIAFNVYSLAYTDLLMRKLGLANSRRGI